MATPNWEQLFDVARTAREKAWAPYSKFKVGTALLLDDGSVIPGCNVENASYGLSLCAERNAIGRMVEQGTARPVAVAIVADSKVATPPCGMCRQTLSEFAPGTLPVHCRNLQGEERRYTLGELLPHAFDRGFF